MYHVAVCCGNRVTYKSNGKMSCREIIAGLGIALIPALAWAGPKRAKQGTKAQKNVLFILADDLRPTLGCYSDPYAITPNIDSLAARGVVFTNAYCQQAVSNPSRASLLTGLRPDQTGVTNLFTDFRTKNPEVVTLPQYFKNNGYYAAGVGKIFHAVKRSVDPVSWSEMHHLERRGYLLQGSLPTGGGKGVSYEAADVPDELYPDGEIADNAVRLIRKAAKRKEPFFIAVGFLKPHLPFNAPKQYRDLYANIRFDIPYRQRPAGAPGIAFHGSNELRGYTDIPQKGPFPDALEQELWRGYYACVSYVDRQIGKLMEALNCCGLTDDTIIVLLGDHGYHLGEQGMWCKSTNFELDTRIPLIVSVPRGKGMGRIDASIVEAVDIYPTLAEYCALPVVGGLAGISLKDRIEQPQRLWSHFAYSQFVRPYQAISKPVATHMGYSVRTPQWRFTAWYRLSDGVVEQTELYRIGSDGVETENLSGNEKYVCIEKRLFENVESYKNGNYKKISE